MINLAFKSVYLEVLLQDGYVLLGCPVLQDGLLVQLHVPVVVLAVLGALEVVDGDDTVGGRSGDDTKDLASVVACQAVKLNSLLRFRFVFEGDRIVQQVSLDKAPLV